MKVCIICQKDVKGKGARVKEDHAIMAIRWIKQRIGIAKNNDLYVCEEDYAAHAAKRKNFEKNLIISAVIAAAFVVMLIGLPLLTGRFDFAGFVGALFIGVLIVLAVVFFRYTPAVEPLDMIRAAAGDKKNRRG